MSRICKLILAALVAASFTMVAGGAYAQDGSPKLSGNAGMGFGQITVSGDEGDASATDLTGVGGSWESNMFIQGNNGKVSYRLRMRFRGKDGPAAAGFPTNSLADSEPQTVRGFVKWMVTDAFSINIRKPGASSVASMAENDPVQNISYAYTGDMSDRLQINFEFKTGAGLFGAMVSAQTPTSQSTNGSATSGGDADNENQNLEFYAKLKFGGIGLNVKMNTASGTGYDGDTTTTADDPTCVAPGVVCDTVDTANADFGTAGTSYDSSGIQVHASIPAGPATVKIDYESSASDIADPDGTTATGEYTLVYIGVKAIIGGINVGFATTAAEVTGSGSDVSGNTATIMNAHYRMPQGKGAWTGPEFATKTVADDSTGSTAADQEITTIRWLQVIKF